MRKTDETLVIAPSGYAVVDRGTGELYELDALAASLPWKQNELAPHEPRMPPHEYVLRSWCDPLTYQRLELIIREHPESYDAYFRAYRFPMRYLEVGGRRYWPTAIGEKRFLNRCLLDSVEPPRRVDEGAGPIGLEEWGAELPYWPRGSGYGKWKQGKDRKWVFYPTDAAVSEVEIATRSGGGRQEEE